MKTFILLVALFSVTRSDKASTTTSDMSGKMLHTMNTIPTTQKQEIYPTYQPVQAQPQYIPIQLIQKPVYIPPQPQTAMIILAHPALVPQQMLYGGGVQHLLNYFHSNPHARYQLINGYQPQPTPQTLLPQNPTTSATIGNYQFAAPPQQNQLISSPSINSQHSYNPTHIQPMQLSALSNLANLHAQQYTQPQYTQQQYSQQQFAPQFSTPIRSIPPIITGLENFTPEQQAHIKAQLNSHLGGSSSLNSFSTNTIAPTNQPGSVIPTPQTTTLLTTTQGQHSTISTPQGQVSGLGQISTKYSSQIQQTSNEYLPEKDDKTETDSSTVYTPSMNYRGQYTTKG